MIITNFGLLSLGQTIEHIATAVYKVGHLMMRVVAGMTKQLEQVRVFFVASYKGNSNHFVDPAVAYVSLGHRWYTRHMSHISS